ncbi:MAG: hypothetical protein ACK5V4_04485 [Alphaproteobacteria bacterium]
MPAALLTDVCALPLLLTADIACTGFKYIVSPIARLAINAFTLCPQSVIHAFRDLLHLNQC